MKQKLTIQQRNDPFNSLTVEQQRVALAQDVIDLLTAKKVEAKWDAYLRDDDFSIYASHTQVCDILDAAKQPVCTACAMGCLLLAHINNTDSFTVANVLRASSQEDKGILIRERLSDIFSGDQLRLMEAAFEPYYDELKTSESFLAKKTYKRFRNDKNRLIAIMKNVIANNGTFVV